MPTRILNARKFTKVLYEGPRRSDIQLHFQSSAPVDVYGVSESLFQLFEEGRKFDLFRFTAKTNLKKRIPVRAVMGEEWYLIIENRSDSPVAIHYEVFDV